MVVALNKFLAALPVDFGLKLSLTGWDFRNYLLILKEVHDIHLLNVIALSTR